MPSAFGNEECAKHLLDWYDRHARVLPWRARRGEQADPYHVWLSEVMLQQTTVRAVIPFFHKFLRNWPTVDALAAADLDQVLSAWAGLGYYARARNLHRCAQEVTALGAFPSKEKELLRLPGIGVYTAAAIAAIAFDKRAVVVDGNVERVVARLLAIEDPLPGAKKEIRRRADEMTPSNRPGDFAQAMMDLGATLCTPRQPSCSRCPFSDHCRGSSLGIADRLPVRAVKKERPRRVGTAFVVERDDGCLLLRRRPEKGLLARMIEVPTTPWLDADTAPDWGAEGIGGWAPVEGDWLVRTGGVAHTFTHFHLDLAVWSTRVSGEVPILEAGEPDRCRWVPQSRLDEVALPGLMRKVLTFALSRSDDGA